MQGKVVEKLNMKNSTLELRFGTVRVLRIPEQLSGGFCQPGRLDQDQVRSLRNRETSEKKQKQLTRNET